MPRPTNAELVEKAQLAEQGQKRCRGCRQVLPVGSFGVQTRASDGLQARCRPCVNSRNIVYDRESRLRDPEGYAARKRSEHARYKERHPDKHKANTRKSNLRKYGLTLESFDEMLAEQVGKCAVCGRELVPGRGLHVDHNHSTGSVRALLCNGCNVGIGAFGESPEALRAAADYLERFIEG